MEKEEIKLKRRTECNGLCPCCCMIRTDKMAKEEMKYVGVKGNIPEGKWSKMEKEIKCPECNKEMSLLDTWDSLLKIATWYRYGCEYCSGLFEVKRGNLKNGKRRNN